MTPRPPARRPFAPAVFLLALALAACPKDGPPDDPEPDDSSCPEEQSSCDAECVDTGSDPRHCGGCGDRCLAGSVCSSGRCAMVGDCNQTPCIGASYCDAVSGLCLPRCTRDEDCLIAGSGCEVGSGTCVCPPQRHVCAMANSCARDDSPAHCGHRCEPCPTDPNGVPTCDGTSCGLACNPGFHLCNGACVRDDEVEHCGTRCEPCPGTADGFATCDGASCGLACNDEFLLCSGACDRCPTDGVTQIGCEAAECVATACVNGHRVCGGACALCPQGSTVIATGCQGASCIATSCAAGYRACGGRCAACPSGDAVAATGCSGASCVASLCEAGYAVCAGDCAPCPTAAVTATSCNGSSCVAASCQAGYRPCAGACAACPSAPAGTAFGCSGAACVVSQCPADHLSCGGACAPCPVEGVGATACEGAACVASACVAGHEMADGECKSWHFQHLRTVSTLKANPDLAVDATGRLHTVWAEYSTGLVYGSDTSGSWLFETVDAASTYGCAIAVDAQGKPHLAWLAVGASGDELRYARRDTAGWSQQTVASGGLWAWHGPDLALDSAGAPVIAFTAQPTSSTYSLTLARPDASGWSFDATGYDGYGPMLAIDASDRPHLLFDRQTLYYATRSGASWSRETVKAGGENGSMSLVLDSAQRPRAAWMRTLPDEAGYAARGATTWSAETLPLPETPDRLGRARMVLDGDAPVILYGYTVAGSTDKRLRLLRKSGTSGWEDRLVFSGMVSPYALELGLRDGEPVLLLHLEGAMKLATFE